MFYYKVKVRFLSFSCQDGEKRRRRSDFDQRMGARISNLRKSTDPGLRKPSSATRPTNPTSNQSSAAPERDRSALSDHFSGLFGVANEPDETPDKNEARTRHTRHLWDIYVSDIYVREPATANVSLQVLSPSSSRSGGSHTRRELSHHRPAHMVQTTKTRHLSPARQLRAITCCQ